ncbi:hypothetical protein [Paenibacillus kandeliae]|uniref:hypothetical protein n=1 Tax=Paenibacillus kandeliae TaxID=3231269 RepID=UPI00345947D9
MLTIHIRHKQLEKLQEPDKGYLGRVELEVEGHAEPYELTLFSKRGHDWDYSLHFLNESGKEEEIEALEQVIEEDDDQFDRIIEAIWSVYPGEDKPKDYR